MHISGMWPLHLWPEDLPIDHLTLVASEASIPGSKELIANKQTLLNQLFSHSLVHKKQMEMLISQSFLKEALSILEKLLSEGQTCNLVCI